LGDTSCTVGQHWILDFMGTWGDIMKYLVGIDAVGANGNSCRTQRLKLRINVGNCREFGRSDKSEITWIEK